MKILFKMKNLLIELIDYSEADSTSTWNIAFITYLTRKKCFFFFFYLLFLCLENIFLFCLPQNNFEPMVNIGLSKQFNVGRTCFQLISLYFFSFSTFGARFLLYWFRMYFLTQQLLWIGDHSFRVLLLFFQILTNKITGIRPGPLSFTYSSVTFPVCLLYIIKIKSCLFR